MNKAKYKYVCNKCGHTLNYSDGTLNMLCYHVSNNSASGVCLGHYINKGRPTLLKQLFNKLKLTKIRLYKKK